MMKAECNITLVFNKNSCKVELQVQYNKVVSEERWGIS